MAKNAKRRHHIERLKKKRKHYWGMFFKGKENLEAKLNIVVRTPKTCACWRCNKPRQRFGKPFSEIRQFQVYS